MAVSNTYSRVVAWAKVILPLLALGLLSTLFLLSNRPDPERAIPFASVNVEELAREQRVGRPRIAGTLSNGREVIFTAERAAPMLNDPRRFSANDIEARIDLSETEVLLIVSEAALFSPADELAELSGSVGLTTSSGLNFSTDLLEINLGLSQVESPGPVTMTGPGMTLTAGGMMATATDGNEVVSFTNGVRVLYEPQN